MGNSNNKRCKIPEQYLKLQGLYSACEWEARHVRRLIMTQKLAPCYPGLDEQNVLETLEECPICMLVINIMLTYIRFVVLRKFL